MSNWKDYEIFVQKLQQALLYSEPLTKQKNIKIERNKKITDNSGIEREFDLYWEYELAGITYKTIIECKDYASEISIDRIDALIGKIRDIPDLKPVFATKTGYQRGAKIKAEKNKIDLLIVREQRDDDWEDAEGNPLIREVNIKMHFEPGLRITKFSPHIDKDWTIKNTEINVDDSFHISVNNEIFIEDIKNNETYSLYDLFHRLESISGDNYGELHYKESFEDAYLKNNDLRLKMKSYEVIYIRSEPLIIPINIDFSKELMGVIEYLDTGSATAIFTDKIIKKMKTPSPDIVIAQEEEGRLGPREPSYIVPHSYPGIDKTPGVCGGDACIRHTRIPVWALVQLRQLGTDEADLLRTYPTLTAEDLVNAWSYYQSHTAEIEQQIVDNELA